jgi:hypothetical protein
VQDFSAASQANLTMAGKLRPIEEVPKDYSRVESEV